MNLVKNGETVEYDNLIAGHEIPFMAKGVEMKTGQGVLLKGSILSKGGDGKCKLIELGEEPYGILTDDFDTEVEKIATMYQQGVFNRAKLIFGEDITSIDVLLDDLRKINILTRVII